MEKSRCEEVEEGRDFGKSLPENKPQHLTSLTSSLLLEWLGQGGCRRKRDKWATRGVATSNILNGFKSKDCLQGKLS